MDTITFFSHANSFALWQYGIVVALSVGQLVHHLGPDWNFKFGWIAIKLSTDSQVS